jgi:hypothetical protein
MSTHMLVVKRTEAMLNIDFRKCSTNIILYYIILLKTSLIEYNIGFGANIMSPIMPSLIDYAQTM